MLRGRNYCGKLISNEKRINRWNFGSFEYFVLNLDSEIIDNKFSNNFYVPKVFESHSSKRVLTSEWVNGVSVDKLSESPQDVINHVNFSFVF